MQHSPNNLYLCIAFLNRATKCFTNKKKDSKTTKQKLMSKNITGLFFFTIMKPKIPSMKSVPGKKHKK
jgi:hypothetical protein